MAQTIHAVATLYALLMPSNSKAAQRNDINYVAYFAGAMAKTPSDAVVDEMLAGDVETAKLFGQHVAATASRLNG